MPLDLIADARALLPDIVVVRRRVHRHPELGLQLPETQETIVDELARLGLTARRGASTTSVTAVIGGGMSGPATILRADMDALPLSEQSGLDFASEIDGRMHACGHDTHVAMLLGAARLLVHRQAELKGPVVLMFQPGEEGFHGARFMLDEGLLDGLDPTATRAFAIHIDAEYASGEIHTRPGPLLASADNFRITVHGRGGHAALPHLALDPIPIAASIVTALQLAVTREVDVFDPAVVTVAHVLAGTTHNIIPETAFLEGTYRTTSDARRTAVGEMVRRVAHGIAAAHGTTADIDFEPIYGPTVNDDGMTAIVRRLTTALLGDAAYVAMPAPSMGAEDWSYVLNRVPGVMVFLGARPQGEDPATFPINHSNRVIFDEAPMAIGAALYAKVGLDAWASDPGT